ncbi:MAG: FAD-dependent oxidoreductase [Leptothrix ochracea]|uniref:FAD-dependent oxidoreductase n=1 Tax=Leptothrix ochracea TaxID=735331 RepID=UPI0034E1C137
MHIAIMGAGITGITTAYELAIDGHRVTVFDRNDMVASEGSFANAGLVSPGCVSPAAAPGLRRWLLRGLFTHESALRWRPNLNRSQWSWLRQWWQACEAPQAEDVRAMVELARLSRERLAGITERYRLDYERSDGVLLLLRSGREFAATHRHMTMLGELGVDAQELTPERCREIEPSLREKVRLAGGLLLADDGVGNCRQFAQMLRDIATEKYGVLFRFGTEVLALDCTQGRPLVHFEQRALRSPGTQDRLPELRIEPYDAVVICGGASAKPVLRSAGLELPILPVYGYSVTLRLRTDGHAPRSAIVDARTGIAITRMGDRVRVTGGFEIFQDRQPLQQSGALMPLYKALHRWYPFAADMSQPQIWKGARPMLPHGPPVVGPAPSSGVWLNVGHGAHGWSLACGSARLLADQIAGREPSLNPQPFSVRPWLR